MENQEKTLKYLTSVETLAEELLADRREIIALDKRRNENREAIRDLGKTNSNKCWLTVGTMLIKHKKEYAMKLIEEDQKQLNIDINKLQTELKIKVNNLRDLEMLPAVPGLMLTPLLQNETKSLSSAGLFPK